MNKNQYIEISILCAVSAMIIWGLVGLQMKQIIHDCQMFNATSAEQHLVDYCNKILEENK